MLKIESRKGLKLAHQNLRTKICRWWLKALKGTLLSLR